MVARGGHRALVSACRRLRLALRRDSVLPPTRCESRAAEGSARDVARSRLDPDRGRCLSRPRHFPHCGRCDGGCRCTLQGLAMSAAATIACALAVPLLGGGLIAALHRAPNLRETA